MTTAEKVALGVAMAGALGLGALLKSIFDHLLGRRARKVDLAEKSIRVADAPVTLAEGQVARVREAMEALEIELAALRARQEEATDAKSTHIIELLDRIGDAAEDLKKTSLLIDIHGRRPSDKRELLKLVKQAQDEEDARSRVGRPH